MFVTLEIQCSDVSRIALGSSCGEGKSSLVSTGQSQIHYHCSSKPLAWFHQACHSHLQELSLSYIRQSANRITWTFTVR